MHEKEMFYTVKMHASRGAPAEHVSGAERIVGKELVAQVAHDLVHRAQKHSKGEADRIVVTVEALDPCRCREVSALPVRSFSYNDPEEGLLGAFSLLASLGINDEQRLRSLLYEMRGMRGAMLVDVRDYTRLDGDLRRGVRATCMDAWGGEGCAADCKQHFAEALVLASKVAQAPGICAEFCVSDDPDYVTGYVASRQLGYCRIAPLKRKGEPWGGRIFFYDGAKEKVSECVRFLEEEPVLVRGIPERIAAVSSEKVEVREQPSDGFHRMLSTKLAQLKSEDLFRRLQTLSQASDAWVEEEHEKEHEQGRRFLQLSSNDYLGLALDYRVCAEAARAAQQYGAGSSGSRLTSGSLSLHRALEESLASFCAKEACLLFSTGYQANLGTISALMGRGDVILSDELNHASIIDGCRLSGARVIVYRHNDMDDLARKAEANRAFRTLVVSDAVFSMDGDLLKLPTFLEIVRRYGCFSMIDQAHAYGVVGEGGRGLEAYYGCTGADITVGTLSKALGSEGGFVCGSALLISFLINRARSFIFSTSAAPASIAGASAALRILQAEPERLIALHRNRAFVEHFLRRLPGTFELAGESSGQSAILPIIVGSEERALRIAEELRSRGILLSAIRYPSVARGRARLRLTVRSIQSREDLLFACEQIASVFAAEREITV